MAEKKIRTLKVYGQSSAPSYRDVSTIILKGKWLEEAGYEIGSKIQVEVGENGSLTVHNIGK